MGEKDEKKGDRHFENGVLVGFGLLGFVIGSFFWSAAPAWISDISKAGFVASALFIFLVGSIMEYRLRKGQIELKNEMD